MNDVLKHSTVFKSKYVFYFNKHCYIRKDKYLYLFIFIVKYDKAWVDIYSVIYFKITRNY